MEKPLPWNKRLRYERLRRGWSQEKLAEKINSNAKTVARWEKGLHVPLPELQQQLAQAFNISIEEMGLLAIEQKITVFPPGKSDPSRQCYEDWEDAPYVPHIYGREQEVASVKHWIEKNGCQIISVLGMGGVGKTTLAVELATRCKSSFEFLFWRSLKNALPLKTILAECIEFLTRQRPDLVMPVLSSSETDLLALFMTLLSRQRCLLVLDNFEAVMRQQDFAGHYLPGYEGYGELLRRVGEVVHGSCLLLTSREKPIEILRLEGNHSIHVINLGGINVTAGIQLLKAEQLQGVNTDGMSLVRRFSGNPLALKLVAESIRELFSSEIAPFLQEGEVIYGDIQDLLSQQFERLSLLEQELVYFLAIEREAITPHDLQGDVAHFVSRGKLIEALESLRRRSFIEIGGNAGHFTLQPVIMEYVTARLVEHICREIMDERLLSEVQTPIGELPWHLASFPLIKADAKDYIKQSQVLLILRPIVDQICTTYGEQKVLSRLRACLERLRLQNPYHPGYLAGNILNLLIALHANLREFDFSHLCVRQVDMRSVALLGVNFAYANFAHSIFNDTFSTIFSIALNHDGTILAAGTSSGEIRLWLSNNAVPLLMYRGHSDWIRSIAFSADGNLLVSGSEDRTLRIWDIRSGRCLMMLEGHEGSVRSVAFSPDNRTVASGSEDGTARLWRIDDGSYITLSPSHRSCIRSVAFSPNGSLLADGNEDQTVRIWEVLTGQCMKTLHGHNAIVRSVAFSADGAFLASAGDDMIVRVWHIQSGQCIRTLQGHCKQVRTICFNWKGDLLASGCEDGTIRIWRVQNGELLFTLYGHTNRISSLAFTPDNQTLVTAGEDQTIRFWEAHTGRCIKTLHGRTNLIKSMAFSPNGCLLAEGSDDRFVRIWELATRTCSRQLHGHAHRIRTVAFSPNGSLLASGSEDYTVRIWQSSSEQCLHVLQGHTHLIRSVAFNQSGTLLASASYDRTVRIWDTYDGRCRAILEHDELVWHVAFCPDSPILISSGKDQKIRLWNSEIGTCVEILSGPPQRVRGIFASQGASTIITGSSNDQRIYLWNARNERAIWLIGHSSWVRALDFRKDGKMVASGSQDQTLRLWDVETGQCLKVLSCKNEISSVVFSHNGEIIAGGDNDGSIYLWDTLTGEQLTVLKREQLYEGMNILGTRGLSKMQRESLLALGAVEHDQERG